MAISASSRILEWGTRSAEAAILAGIYFQDTVERVAAHFNTHKDFHDAGEISKWAPERALELADRTNHALEPILTNPFTSLPNFHLPRNH